MTATKTKTREQKLAKVDALVMAADFVAVEQLSYALRPKQEEKIPSFEDIDQESEAKFLAELNRCAQKYGMPLRKNIRARFSDDEAIIAYNDGGTIVLNLNSEPANRAYQKAVYGVGRSKDSALISFMLQVFPHEQAHDSHGDHDMHFFLAEGKAMREFILAMLLKSEERDRQGDAKDCLSTQELLKTIARLGRRTL
jgi:hypothetical protein